MRTKIFEVIEKEEFDIIPFCPVVSKSVSKKGLVEIIEVPLLENYMLWYYDREILPYSYLKDYISFRHLSFGGKARYVEQYEVDYLEMVANGRSIRFNRLRLDSKYLKQFIGRTVIVRDKLLSGLIGTVRGVKKAGVLYIDLMVFRRMVTCEISVEHIEFM